MQQSVTFCIDYYFEFLYNFSEFRIGWVLQRFPPTAEPFVGRMPLLFLD